VSPASAGFVASPPDLHRGSALDPAGGRDSTFYPPLANGYAPGPQFFYNTLHSILHDKQFMWELNIASNNKENTGMLDSRATKKQQ